MYTIKIVYYEKRNQHGVSDKKGQDDPLVIPANIYYRSAGDFNYRKYRSSFKQIDDLITDMNDELGVFENTMYDQQPVNFESLEEINSEQVEVLRIWLTKDNGDKQILDVMNADIFIMQNGKTIDTVRTSHS